MAVLDAKGRTIRPGMAAKDQFGTVYEVVSIEATKNPQSKSVRLKNGPRWCNKAGSELEVLR